MRSWFVDLHWAPCCGCMCRNLGRPLYMPFIYSSPRLRKVWGDLLFGLSRWECDRLREGLINVLWENVFLLSWCSHLQVLKPSTCVLPEWWVGRRQHSSGEGGNGRLRSGLKCLHIFFSVITLGRTCCCLFLLLILNCCCQTLLSIKKKWRETRRLWCVVRPERKCRKGVAVHFKCVCVWKCVGVCNLLSLSAPLVVTFFFSWSAGFLFQICIFLYSTLLAIPC